MALVDCGDGKIGYRYTNSIVDDWYSINGIRGGKTPPVTVTVPGYKMVPEIKKVIFNNPATIVFWKDGTKTVVKCMEGMEFDKWDGLSMAICKKLYGKSFKRTFKKWCKDE